MTRVRDQIVSLRQERERLFSGVRRETRDRKLAVSQMLAEFLQELTEIARRRRAGRIGFMAGLRPTVHNLQQETREDLGGVREALAGLNSSPSSAAVGVRQNQEAVTYARGAEPATARRTREIMHPCSKG